jgi:hypothetical protein
VNGVTTNYVVASISQVLSDGTETYLYGNNRIAQVGALGTDYFLGDALGSVRQLVDTDGVINLNKNYDLMGIL